ncbi:uncharacterized protein LOC134527858 isoform X1 [Bacillus rossius redtenbacheri]|uniref:uncharacterized protein LOC134527858 isoform X1 n=1 Tax=Bacillus rossius redtenbacheri TaxID=93214 RepID=UPI002FDDB973
MGGGVKKHYWQCFRKDYSEEFSFILKSDKGQKYAFCSVCRCDISISHGGRSDILLHVKSNKHAGNVQNSENSQKISTFFTNSSSEDSVTRAECLFTYFLIEHNVPLSAADHAGPLFRKMFPKSEEAQKYACGRTKTTAIVEEMAKDSRDDVVKHLQTGPFSLSTDGTNDTDSKLYPIVVTYFDKNIENIVSSVLSLPDLQGDSTGLNIGNLIINELERFNIPLKNMIAFSADNAAVMMGKKNGVVAVLKNRQENLFVMGCLCHRINLAAEKGTDNLPLNVEEALTDIFYYLEKSGKRKDCLKKFQNLHGCETRKILKHVCTKWLSLGKSLTRLVEQWDPLLSFFKDQVKCVKPSCSVGISSFTIPKQPASDHSVQPLVSKSSKSSQQGFSLKRKHSESEDKIITKKTGTSHNEGKSTFPSVRSENQKSLVNITSGSLSLEEKLFMFLSSSVNKAFCLFLLHIHRFIFWEN